MGVNYSGLFKLLKTNKLSKTDLITKLGISSRTLAKFANEEYVSMRVINDLCNLFSCNPSDLFVFIDDVNKSQILSVIESERALSDDSGLYNITLNKFVRFLLQLNNINLNIDDIKNLLSGNMISTDQRIVLLEDVMYVLNIQESIAYLINNVYKELDLEMLKDLYYLLTKNLSSNQFTYKQDTLKKRNNEFLGKITSNPIEVEGNLKNLINLYNSKRILTIEDIYNFINEFTLISPFDNYNFEVSILIALKEELKKNVTPFIINDNDVNSFVDAFSSKNQNREKALDLMKAGQEYFTELVRFFIK